MAAGATPFRFRPARLRFPAQHSFFEVGQEGDVQRHLYLQELLSGAEAAPPRRPPGAPPEICCHVAGCRQTFASLQSYEHHYNALHRDVCSACGRAFPSAHLLDLHLLEWHDSLFRVTAQRQEAYQCLVESCTEKFKNSKDRKDHLVQVHRYPSDFRFDKPMKAQSYTKPRRPSPRDGAVPMDVNTEASEQVPGDAMETGCTENMMEDVCQPTMESTLVLPTCQRRLYRARIPSTVCFGQGAPRGFRGRNKNT